MGISRTKKPGHPLSVFALGCLEYIIPFKKKNKFYVNFDTVLRGNLVIDLSN